MGKLSSWDPNWTKRSGSRLRRGCDKLSAGEATAEDSRRPKINDARAPLSPFSPPVPVADTKLVRDHNCRSVDHFHGNFISNHVSYESMTSKHLAWRLVSFFISINRISVLLFVSHIARTRTLHEFQYGRIPNKARYLVLWTPCTNDFMR